jgi:cytolysin-activating lysine-acyltransferase
MVKNTEPKKGIKVAPRISKKNETHVIDSSASKGPLGVANKTPIDPETIKNVVAARARLHEGFGQVILSLSTTPRYKHITIGELPQFVLAPLVRDRIVIARSNVGSNEIERGFVGIAIWASVSEEVNIKIQDQIKSGIFPVRLDAAEWASGDINWLLDIVASVPQVASAVLANFKQVVKGGELRLHPIMTKLIDSETLKNMGVQVTSNPS